MLWVAPHGLGTAGIGPTEVGQKNKKLSTIYNQNNVNEFPFKLNQEKYVIVR